jgi:gliding motility-associated-like protein
VYRAEAQVCLFNDTTIYHQRKRIHRNEGLPFEPPSLRLDDGGFLNIKLMGDSTFGPTDGSRVDYYRIHTSDTASMCLGVRDSANSIWHFSYEPIEGRRIDTVRYNIFSESRPKSYATWSFETTKTPSCTITSHCDTLDIRIDPAVICPGNSATVTIHKNSGCGSLVPLVYDTNFVSSVSKVNDTTFIFQFTQPGAGFIKGSLMGCVLIKDSIYVQVLPARNQLSIGPDTIICQNNQILLNAGSGFASYEWSDGSTDSTLVVRLPGTYYVTAINSCGGVFSDTVIVNDHPPIAFNAGGDRIKCNNDTLRISASAGFISYQWSPAYNISSTNSQQVIVNPLMDTSYMVMAEKTPGCFAFDTVRVTVNLSPPINLGADTSICEGDSLVLNAGSGFISYQWNTGSLQQQLTVKQQGVYTIQAAAVNGCSSADTLRLVSLYSLPQPDLGANPVLCVGQIRVLSPGGNYSSHLWSTSETSSTITVNATGMYWVSVIDDKGCHGTDTLLITSTALPPQNFLGADTSICTYYGKLILRPAMNFDQYLWSTGISSPSLTITQAGNYWLDVVDQNDCKGRDSILVRPKVCAEGLFVPTAFTPNNDGLNDFLTPFIFGETEIFRFQVYNRWGEVVFETSSPGKGWDGRYKGQPQDSNVYIWTCNYQLKGKKAEQKNGSFVLIR